MCSLHLGFVWISEPMVGTVKLCLKTVLSAHYHYHLYGIYSDQKYKN